MADSKTSKPNFYVLPPSFEVRDSQIYGYLCLSIGKLIFPKNGIRPDFPIIKARFWGEKTQGQVLRPSNSGKELTGLPTSIRYQIRCPIQGFQRYLCDSPKIKLTLCDPNNDKAWGTVNILIGQYIKQNISKNDISPHEDISATFEIESTQKNKSYEDKLGELEVRITSVFDPPETPNISSIEPTTQRGLIHSINDHLESSFLENERKAQEQDSNFGLDVFLPERRSPFQSSRSKSPVPKLPFNPNESQISTSQQETFRRQSPKSGHTSIFGGESSTRVSNIFKPLSTDPLGSLLPSNVIGNSSKTPRQQNLYDENQFEKQMDQLLFKDSSPIVFNPKPLPKSNNKCKPIDSSPEKIDIFLRDPSQEPTKTFSTTAQKLFPISPKRSASYDPNLNSTSNSNQNKRMDRSAEKFEKVRQQLEMVSTPDRPKENNFTFKRPQTQESSNLKDIDTLKVLVHELECMNENLNSKMKQGKVFVECQVPALMNTPESPVFDSYKFFSNGFSDGAFSFDNEINQKVARNHIEFARLLYSKVNFRIFLAVPNKFNKFGGDENNIEIGSAEITLNSLFRTPSYQDHFAVKIFSKFASILLENEDSSRSPSRIEPRMATRTQKIADELSPTSQSAEVAVLRVSLQFLSTVQTQRDLSPRPRTPVVEKTPNRETRQISSGSLQMLLYIEKVLKISPKEEKDSLRNIYMAYKIYGSSERVQTEVNWKSNSPYIDHKMVFPISEDHVSKMDVLPLIIEVWDKNESAKDKLIGLVKLSLSNVFKGIWISESEEINHDFFKTSQYPMLIWDDSISIQDLKNLEIGQIQLSLALGTPIQLNKFENRIQEKRNKHQETSSKVQPEAKKEMTPATPQNPSKDTERTPQPLKEEEEPVESERGPSKPGYEVLTEVLEHLRRKADAQIKSHSFMTSTNKYTSTQELVNFLCDPSHLVKIGQARQLTKLLDLEKSGQLNREYFTKSYLAYYECEKNVRTRFCEIVKNLKLLLDTQGLSVMAFDKILASHSEFGYIKKPVFKETLEKLNLRLPKPTFEYLLGMLDYNDDGYIFISHLMDYLKALDREEILLYLNLNQLFFQNEVSKTTAEVLKFSNLNRERVESTFENFKNKDQILSIEVIMQLFVRIGCALSFWEALSLSKQIKAKMMADSTSETTIQGHILYEWVMHTAFPETSSPERKNRFQNESHLEDSPKMLNPSTLPKKQMKPDLVMPESARASIQSNLREAFQDNDDDLIGLLNPKAGNNKTPVRETLNYNNRASLEFDDKVFDLLNSKNVTPQVLNNGRRDFGSEDDSFFTRSAKPTKEEKTPENVGMSLLSKLEEKIVKTLEAKLEEKLPKLENKKSSDTAPSRQSSTQWGAAKHSLKLSVSGLNQLNLGYTYHRSTCFLRCMFPNVEKHTDSNTFEYNAQVKDYQDVKLIFGQSWTLSSVDELLELIQSPSEGVVLQLVLREDDETEEIVGYSIIPTDELDTLVKNAKIGSYGDVKRNEVKKSMMLLKNSKTNLGFSFQQDLLAGKINISMEYTSEQADAETSQTLPTFVKRASPVKIIEKTYLKLRLNYLNNLRKGLTYFLERDREFMSNIGSNPQLSVFFNLFPEDSTLNAQVPSFEETISSSQVDFTEMEMNEEFYQEIETQLLGGNFNNKSALIEFRLWNKATSTSVTICSTTIPLAKFTTQGVKGEFALTNPIGCYSGVLSLEVSVFKGVRPETHRKTPSLSIEKSVKEEKIQPVSDNKKELYFLMIYFSEILSLMENSSYSGDSDSNICFEANVDGESKKTIPFNFERNKTKIELRNQRLLLCLGQSSSVLISSLEIKVIEQKKSYKSDNVLGKVTLNVKSLLSDIEYKKNISQSFFAPVFDIDTCRAIKMRVGTKIMFVKPAQSIDVKKLQNYMSALNDNNSLKRSELLVESDYTSIGTVDKYSMKEALRDSSDLTPTELDDFIGLIMDANCRVNYDPLTIFIKNELNVKKNVEEEAWKNLKNQFSYYDYRNEGFVDFDGAKSVLSSYIGLIFNGDSNGLKRFSISSMGQSVAEFGYVNTDMIDYVVLMNKIQIGAGNKYDINMYSSRASYEQDRLPSYREKPSQPSFYFSMDTKLKIDIQYGKNFHQFNKGIAPNSFVRVLLAPKDSLDFKEENSKSILLETTVVSRAAEPEFNTTKDISGYEIDSSLNLYDYELIIRVYHKSYNANFSERIHSFAVIGEGKISFKSIINEERIFYNDFLPLEPFANTHYNQSAKPVLKLRLSSDSRSNFSEARSQVSVRESYNVKPYEQPIERKSVAMPEEDPDIDLNMINNFMKTLQEINGKPEPNLESYVPEKRNRYEAPSHDEFPVEKVSIEIEPNPSRAIQDLAEINKTLDTIMLFRNAQEKINEAYDSGSGSFGDHVNQQTINFKGSEDISVISMNNKSEDHTMMDYSVINRELNRELNNQSTNAFLKKGMPFVIDEDNEEYRPSRQSSNRILRKSYENSPSDSDKEDKENQPMNYTKKPQSDLFEKIKSPSETVDLTKKVTANLSRKLPEKLKENKELARIYNIMKNEKKKPLTFSSDSDSD